MGTSPRPPQLLSHIPPGDSRPKASSHAKDETKLQNCFKFLVKSCQEAEERVQSDLSSRVCVGLKAEERYLNKLLDRQHGTGVQYPVRG